MRLYCNIRTPERKKELGIGSNDNLSFELLVGSKRNPKNLLNVALGINSQDSEYVFQVFDNENQHLQVFRFPVN